MHHCKTRYCLIIYMYIYVYIYINKSIFILYLEEVRLAQYV